MLHRISIANVSRRDLADELATLGIDGTAVDATGFTAKWGLEDGALALVAGRSTDVVQAAARSLCGLYGEDAAYVDNGTNAWLVYGDGRTELLT